jgi:alpha-1,2-mannosyltransferase
MLTPGERGRQPIGGVAVAVPVDERLPGFPDRPSDASATSDVHGDARWPWLVGAVALLAFVARIVPMLRGGGLVSSDGYDDSVYYAAATALVHGRGPYDDFLLLHPPGLILALTPFAALARITSDTVGQDVARVAFMLLGTLNTVLVMRIGRRFGMWAGVGAGLVYAVSFPALYAERTTTLEALGSTTLLVALVLLVRPAARRAGRMSGVPASSTLASLSRARLVGAGLALGAGAGVKIWGVVPLVVIAGWVLLTAGRRAAAWVVAAAAAAVTAICLPFFADAPSQMWRYVVVDQIGRPRTGVPILQRLTEMAGLQFDVAHQPGALARLTLALVLTVVAVAAVAALRTPGASVLVALLLSQAMVLLASPSFFLHYLTLTAAPGALVLGVGSERFRRWQQRRLPVRAGRLTTLSAVSAAAVVLGAGIPGVVHPVGKAFPPELTAAAARTKGCITADDPTYLIEMNVLSRDFDAGCPVWVDVTGLTYDPAGGGGNGSGIHRTTDPTWQHQVMGYLLSGKATVVARSETGLDHQSRRHVHRLPVVAHDDGFALRQVG